MNTIAYGWTMGFSPSSSYYTTYYNFNNGIAYDIFYTNLMYGQTGFSGITGVVSNYQQAASVELSGVSQTCSGNTCVVTYHTPWGSDLFGVGNNVPYTF